MKNILKIRKALKKISENGYVLTITLIGLLYSICSSWKYPLIPVITVVLMVLVELGDMFG